jgi:hypothetical protein
LWIRENYGDDAEGMGVKAWGEAALDAGPANFSINIIYINENNILFNRAWTRRGAVMCLILSECD